MLHFSNIGVAILQYIFLSHFAPVTGKSETLQQMMILSRYHGSNQDSLYKLSVVYVEKTKVYPIYSKCPDFAMTGPVFWFTIPVSRIESICPGF